MSSAQENEDKKDKIKKAKEEEESLQGGRGGRQNTWREIKIAREAAARAVGAEFTAESWFSRGKNERLWRLLFSSCMTHKDVIH